MYKTYYDTEVGIVFLRFQGAVIGAETQRATVEAVSQLDDPSSVRGFFVDYREATALDRVDSDRALFSITARKLLALGLDIRPLNVTWVSDPTRPDLAAVLAKRNDQLAMQRVNGAPSSHSAGIKTGFLATEKESQVEQAFRVLGLPKDYCLPY